MAHFPPSVDGHCISHDFFGCKWQKASIIGLKKEDTLVHRTRKSSICLAPAWLSPDIQMRPHPFHLLNLLSSVRALFSAAFSSWWQNRCPNPKADLPPFQQPQQRGSPRSRLDWTRVGHKPMPKPMIAGSQGGGGWVGILL